jgi:hypothetical protein
MLRSKGSKDTLMRHRLLKRVLLELENLSALITFRSGEESSPSPGRANVYQFAPIAVCQDRTRRPRSTRRTFKKGAHFPPAA